MQVLDARDPQGTRCYHLEKQLKEKPPKLLETLKSLSKVMTEARDKLLPVYKQLKSKSDENFLSEAADGTSNFLLPLVPFTTSTLPERLNQVLKSTAPAAQRTENYFHIYSEFQDFLRKAQEANLERVKALLDDYSKVFVLGEEHVPAEVPDD